MGVARAVTIAAVVTFVGVLAQPADIVHGREAAAPVPSYFGELVRPPLDGAIVVNGTFGEHRSGHFHAGLDLSTGGEIGRPVYAPLNGWVERVRTSGVGYGRSIYLRTDDGRLLVFAHLDQFVEPLATYVAETQEAAGRYEQDLWPDRGRFRFEAGEVIAWTGQSGAGPPHLHFEIRGSDTAYNPLLAGFSIPDSLAPHLEHVRLEPLDSHSFVSRPATMTHRRLHSSAPVTRPLSSRAETLVVLGRVRAIVTARDRFGRVGRNGAPWSVKTEFDGHQVECRFDRASWAGDMSESDFLYREGGGKRRGLRLWAPQAYRPVVMRTSAADGEAAGVIEVRDGDPPRTLDISARDVAGNLVQRSVVLRPPRAGRNAHTRVAVDEGGVVRDRAPGGLTFASLAGRHIRIEAAGSGWERAEVRAIAIDGDTMASVFGVARAAVLDARALPRTTRLRVLGGGKRVERWTATGPTLRLSAAHEGASDAFGELSWEVPMGALFEPGVLVAESLGVAEPTRELQPIGRSFALRPNDLPLRKSIRVWLDAPAIDSLEGVGLYRSAGNGWSFLDDSYDDSMRRFATTTSALGTFSLMRDVKGPRIRLRRPRWLGPDLGYSQWQLRAVLTELGSGVDRRASYFEVNGKRVPTEWDPEANMLRWRPLKRPAAGTYRYSVVAADQAGNVTRRSSRFVLD